MVNLIAVGDEWYSCWAEPAGPTLDTEVAANLLLRKKDTRFPCELADCGLDCEPFGAPPLKRVHALRARQDEKADEIANPHYYQTHCINIFPTFVLIWHSSKHSSEMSKSNNNYAANNQHGVSTIVGSALVVNYLLGTGFLCIPYGFKEAGLVLSSITLVVVLFVTDITKDYVLTSMALAEAVFGIRRKATTTIGYGSVDSKNEEAAWSDQEAYQITQTKFEYAELVRIFLGKVAESIYITSVSLTQYLCLWGYTQVFASAMAVQFPIADGLTSAYALYTFVFALLVVPLSCLNLDEQIFLQLLLSACRFFLIGCMVISTLQATFDVDKTYFITQQGPRGAELFRLEGFYCVFPIIVYSSLFHNGIPVLSEPIEDKQKVASMFRWTIMVCCVIFWLFGFFIANLFGENVKQSANLQWNDYVGGTGYLGRYGWEGTALWSQGLSVFVVVFPALNCISSFPLNAIVLGNNMMATIYGDNVQEYERNIRIRVAYRLLSTVPPIVGALFVRELGLITAYAGLFSIATAFVFPPLLYIRSKAMARTMGLGEKTCYEDIGSSKIAAITICLLSSISILFVFWSLIYCANE